MFQKKYWSRMYSWKYFKNLKNWDVFTFKTQYTYEILHPDIKSLGLKNEIRSAEKVNRNFDDRMYLRSLGIVSYNAVRDSNIILPSDHRHFRVFDEIINGYYIKYDSKSLEEPKIFMDFDDKNVKVDTDNDFEVDYPREKDFALINKKKFEEDEFPTRRIIRKRRVIYYWRRELDFFNDAQIDILSEYLHLMPVNLKPADCITFMEYVLWLEGCGWINRADKISNLRSKFGFEEYTNLSLNPDGDSDWVENRLSKFPCLDIYYITPYAFFVYYSYYVTPWEVRMLYDGYFSVLLDLIYITDWHHYNVMQSADRVDRFFTISTIVGLSTFYLLRNAPLYDAFTNPGFDYHSMFFGTVKLDGMNSSAHSTDMCNLYRDTMNFFKSLRGVGKVPVISQEWFNVANESKFYENADYQRFCNAFAVNDAVEHARAFRNIPADPTFGEPTFCPRTRDHRKFWDVFTSPLRYFISIYLNIMQHGTLPYHSGEFHVKAKPGFYKNNNWFYYVPKKNCRNYVAHQNAQYGRWRMGSSKNVPFSVYRENLLKSAREWAEFITQDTYLSKLTRIEENKIGFSYRENIDDFYLAPTSIEFSDGTVVQLPGWKFVSYPQSNKLMQRIAKDAKLINFLAARHRRFMPDIYGHETWLHGWHRGWSRIHQYFNPSMNDVLDESDVDLYLKPSKVADLIGMLNANIFKKDFRLLRFLLELEYNLCLDKKIINGQSAWDHIATPTVNSAFRTFSQSALAKSFNEELQLDTGLGYMDKDIVDLSSKLTDQKDILAVAYNHISDFNEHFIFPAHSVVNLHGVYQPEPLEENHISLKFNSILRKCVQRTKMEHIMYEMYKNLKTVNNIYKNTLSREAARTAEAFNEGKICFRNSWFKVAHYPTLTDELLETSYAIKKEKNEGFKRLTRKYKYINSIRRFFKCRQKIFKNRRLIDQQLTSAQVFCKTYKNFLRIWSTCSSRPRFPNYDYNPLNFNSDIDRFSALWEGYNRPWQYYMLYNMLDYKPKNHRDIVLRYPIISCAYRNPVARSFYKDFEYFRQYLDAFPEMASSLRRLYSQRVNNLFTNLRFLTEFGRFEYNLYGWELWDWFQFEVPGYGYPLNLQEFSPNMLYSITFLVDKHKWTSFDAFEWTEANRDIMLYHDDIESRTRTDWTTIEFAKRWQEIGRKALPWAGESEAQLTSKSFGRDLLNMEMKNAPEKAKALFVKGWDLSHFRFLKKRVAEITARQKQIEEEKKKKEEDRKERYRKRREEFRLRAEEAKVIQEEIKIQERKARKKKSKNVEDSALFKKIVELAEARSAEMGRPAEPIIILRDSKSNLVRRIIIDPSYIDAHAPSQANILAARRSISLPDEPVFKIPFKKKKAAKKKYPIVTVYPFLKRHDSQVFNEPPKTPSYDNIPALYSEPVSELITRSIIPQTNRPIRTSIFDIGPLSTRQPISQSTQQVDLHRVSSTQSVITPKWDLQRTQQLDLPRDPLRESTIFSIGRSTGLFGERPLPDEQSAVQSSQRVSQRFDLRQVDLTQSVMTPEDDPQLNQQFDLPRDPLRESTIFCIGRSTGLFGERPLPDEQSAVQSSQRASQRFDLRQVDLTQSVMTPEDEDPQPARRTDPVRSVVVHSSQNERNLEETKFDPYAGMRRSTEELLEEVRSSFRNTRKK